MILGIMPHEDPVVGVGLAIFGAAMFATHPRLPRVPHVPAWAVAGLGLAGVILVLGYRLLFPAPLDIPKVTMLILGVGLVACAPFLNRSFRFPARSRPLVRVDSVVACALAILGAPLAVWALQAAFKGLVGATPVEAFIRVALLPPVGAVLWAWGLEPAFSGQTITYATPRGPLSVDVGAACSGVQAMALFGAVLALYLVAERPGGRRLALWSLIGIAGVYVTNLVRLTTLMAVGYAWGADALVRVHAQAGWVFFVAWAVLFAWIARSPAARRGRGARASPR